MKCQAQNELKIKKKLQESVLPQYFSFPNIDKYRRECYITPILSGNLMESGRDNLEKNNRIATFKLKGRNENGY